MAQLVNEEGLLALGTVSALRRLHSQYVKDLDWVQNDHIWEKARFAVPLPFLDAYAVECGGGPSSDDTLGVRVMRNTIVATQGSYTLRTTLAIPVSTPAAGDVPARRTPSIPLPEVFGRLRENKWLNDTIVNFALQLLASDHSDVSVIDSLSSHNPAAPPAFLTLQRLVVFPINIDNKHWCVICVEFDWAKETATAYAYDPIGKGKYNQALEDAWASWRHPLLQTWLKRDQRRVLSGTNSPEVKQLPDIALHFAVVGTPKQQDGYSCGAYCIVHACCYMTDNFSMHDFATFSPSRLQVIRLRLMYTILTKAVPRLDDEGRRRAKETKEVFHGYAGEGQGTPVQTSARRTTRSKKASKDQEGRKGE